MGIEDKIGNLRWIARFIVENSENATWVVGGQRVVF